MTARVYQVLPPLTAEEYGALKADIAGHGVLVPVEIDEQGQILDGHHRVKACAELGITTWPTLVRPGLSEDEKVAHALSLNLTRRHLTPGQRRAVVVALRQQGWSMPRIAQRLQVAVGTVHGDLANFSKLKSRVLPARSIGKDGKSRPALRPAVIAKTGRETRRVLAALSTVPAQALPRTLLDMKRVERLAREQHGVHRAQTLSGDVEQGDLTLLFGDMRHRGAEIPDHSVALIFTDPPYGQDSLPLWSALSQLAGRVLTSGGMLVAYTGQAFLPEVLAGLGQRLRYWWCGTIVLPGPHRCVFPQRMANGAKLLLFYVRQDGAGPRYASCVDTLRGAGPQKEAHDWQQGVSEARYYIAQLTQPGAVVLDPFLGSGTTGLAALQLGRHFLGMECAPGAFCAAHDRLTTVTEPEAAA